MVIVQKVSFFFFFFLVSPCDSANMLPFLNRNVRGTGKAQAFLDSTAGAHLGLPGHRH